MEREAFTWRFVTGDEVAARLAAAPRVARFWAEPIRIVLRVGERHRLWPLRVFATDAEGDAISYLSASLEGVADSAIVEYAPLTGLTAIAPGDTYFILRSGLPDKHGNRPTFHIEITVQPA